MSGRVYYNEHDPVAAAWLRELIAQKELPSGEVDTRSIVDVRAGDLVGFRQCHFFAGIGGWAYALQLAGWPADRECWTGSCPCQPWSVAGSGEGTDDPRHLWPAWFPLIRERRPRTVFGEQTASKDGEYWLDLVSTDMEKEDYAIGPFDLPAGGVGTPHRRQRFWFVADDNRARRAELGLDRLRQDGDPHAGHDVDGRGATSDRPVAHAARRGQRADGRASRARGHVDERGEAGDMEDTDSGAREEGLRATTGEANRGGAHGRPAGSSVVGRSVVDAISPGLEGHAGHGDDGDQPGWFGADAAGSITASGAVRGFWGGGRVGHLPRTRRHAQSAAG